jgi:hypothetical protein
VSDVENLQPNVRTDGSDKESAVRDAAEELATRLEALADTLAATTPPQRVPFGPGRFGPFGRRLSPKGHIIDPGSLKMVLPDGRLWSYSRSEADRFPTGRLFDARVAPDPGYTGNRSFLVGREFIFLGVVLAKYSFGWAAPYEKPGDVDSGGLRAIYGEGPTVRWVTADKAFSAIANSALATTDRSVFAP